MVCIIDIVIQCANPDGSTVVPVLINQPAYDEYLDRPKRISAKIEKGSGLDVQGIAKVTRHGKIILIGHISKLDLQNQAYDSIVIDSAEYLLEQRIGQFYRYPAGTTLNAILASDMGGSVVGLLAMANGLIPRGAWEVHSGFVYKVSGAGTSSRFGTLTALYQNGTLLTKYTTIPNAAGKWWQSATNLYVWCTDSRSPDYHLIIAPNHKDTLVRLGNITNGTSTFPVCYEIGPAKLSPAIKALILAGGLEYSFRYEKDGYAYLDAVASVGKGSESLPVATFIDGKNAEILPVQADGVGRIQALLGQGAGAGVTQQCSAAIDFSTRGTWREAIYQAGGLFGAMLKTATSKVFSDSQDPTSYQIRPLDSDWNQAVGNYIGIIRGGYQPIARRIKHIGMKSDGSMIIEAGQRLRTLQELLKAGEELQNILQSFYGAHTKNAWSWSLPETNIDSFTGVTHEFLLASTDDSTKTSGDKTIGSGEIDPNFPFQVLLNLKVGWYTANTNQAYNEDKSHGNVGGHSGYSGGTTPKTQDGHSVPATTAMASGGYVTSFVSNPYVSVWIAGNTYTSSGSSHWHWFEQGATDYLGTSLADPVGHVHYIPDNYTYDAGAQQHEWGAGSGGTGGAANTRAGSAKHAAWDSILDGLRKQYGTGNSIHYLTLSVKVNGVAVPGSPFQDLYVGDSLDNIDITSLVTVGQKNTISVQVTEYGGTSAVRCSVSGNINVNAIISAF